MGWSFRKSKSFGAFRFNFSGSGVGMSFGIKGARVTINKRGTYVTLGANGIYYRQRMGHATNSLTEQPVPEPINPVHYADEVHSITTHTIENVTDVNSKAFVEELESKANKISFFRFFGIWPSIIILLLIFLWINQKVVIRERYQEYFEITRRSVNVRAAPSKEGAIVNHAYKFEKYAVVSVDTATGWIRVLFKHPLQGEGFIRIDMGAMSNVLVERSEATRLEQHPGLRFMFLIVLILLAVWCIFLHKQDKKRMTVELYYTFDEAVETLHHKFLDFFREFTTSAKIWQKLHSRGVDNRKYNAGASQLVRRTAVGNISLHKLPLSFLKTNVAIPCIQLRNTSLYFFPERVILKRGNKFGAVFYKNIHIAIKNVQFIEEESVPRDAQILDYTWKYPNKNGGPDRRFNNNTRIPICLYTDYCFESDGGLYEVITTSKTGGMNNFASFIEIIADFQRKTSLN